MAGLFTPNDEMSAALEAAGAKVGEKLWRMPMEASYWEQMESPIADMKNTGMVRGLTLTLVGLRLGLGLPKPSEVRVREPNFYPRVSPNLNPNPSPGGCFPSTGSVS